MVMVRIRFGVLVCIRDRVRIKDKIRVRKG